MLTLPIAGRRIQREIAELEESLNHTLACAAALTQSIALTRNLPEVGAATAQECLLRLSEIQSGLTKCSNQAVRMHGDLRKINEDVKAVPDEDGDCPWPQLAPMGQDENVAA